MLREQIEEFLEMLESDYTGATGEVKKILKNYITDLNDILDETENEG